MAKASVRYLSIVFLVIVAIGILFTRFVYGKLSMEGFRPWVCGSSIYENKCSGQPCNKNSECWSGECKRKFISKKCK